METLRLFLAIDIDNNLKEKIILVKEQLEQILPQIKWTKPDTWHLTIKFLGETKKNKVDEIKKLCKDIAIKYSSFDIILKNISAFPNLRMPRVIFIDTEIPKELEKIFEEIEDKLSVLGFKKEDRKFHPHLTLARLKDIKPFLKDNEKIIEKIGEIGRKIHFSMIAKEIVLYQSILSSKGPTYTKIETFTFNDSSHNGYQ